MRAVVCLLGAVVAVSLAAVASAASAPTLSQDDSAHPECLWAKEMRTDQRIRCGGEPFVPDNDQKVDAASKSNKTDCSAEDFKTDARIDAVDRAPSCRRAYAIMKRCALGASGDSPVGGAVRNKCEKLFLPRLDATHRRTYRRELKRCGDKYANEMGTMYISMAAFCATEHAVRWAAPYERRR